jgi:hypothetical protein
LRSRAFLDTAPNPTPTRVRERYNSVGKSDFPPEACETDPEREREREEKKETSLGLRV